MAPSPENDNAPKAPDKSDKTKLEKSCASDSTKENDKDEKTLSNLNDGELKALLDEAINYKNPKDREGKSKLFKDLLNQAEETERIARATIAGGSEVARHYNTSAARRHHGRHSGGFSDGSGGTSGHHAGGRHHGRHRKPSSISENMMHGGSLDNLAKEELFSDSRHCLVNKMKTVSARQREGGSLPCDVNSSVITSHDYQFIEEAKKNKAMKDKEYTAIDIESSLETQRLLDHDSLAENYQESQEITIVPRYTSKATLQISATPVDEAIPLDLDSVAEKKPFDLELLQTKLLNSKYNVYIPKYRSTEERKVDENGNALHQNPGTRAKKKKIQTDKNVVVLKAESVEGHRSDIINDLDKLIQYVQGDNETSVGKSTKSNVHKSKQLHKQHTSEDSGRGSSNNVGKKQRSNFYKGKESRSEMKKSNSLGEISTAKLEDFTFVTSTIEDDGDNKVVLRPNKGQTDRPKERRSWGNVEPPSFKILSSNASTENLETTENWVVTKTKKKSKKRRNSVSSSSRRQVSTAEAQAAKQHPNRAPSPDFRGKSISSMPHSEKSDSSDADSVHSLPIDSTNIPISYADIAKNTEKAKEKKVSLEKTEKVPTKDNKSPKTETESTKKEKPYPSTPNNINNNNNTKPLVNLNVNHVKTPPDVHNVKNFPAISSDNTPKNVHNILPPDVNDTRNFPAMTIESYNLKSPPIVLDAHAPHIFPDSRQFPPNVYDTKSFPAMPTDGSVKGFFSWPVDVNSSKNSPSIPSNNNNNINNNPSNNKVEKSNNVKNTSISGKVTNVPAGNKGMFGNTGGKGTFNNNNNINNNNVSTKAGASQNSVCANDIQNDLSILHSNEKESIQFNAQMLPPNIPDVQTIEKMHFMNCHPPHTQILQHLPTSSHQTSTNIVSNRPVASEFTQTSTTDNVSSPICNQTKQTNCDMSDRTTVEIGRDVQEAGEDDNEEGPPPVVILSGIGNKEVTGLVFGFDVNEQLLHEDICENFISRFVAPENYTQSSHNHDKIVNFIGSAWEAIINQSNGKVQYYTEES